MNGQDLFNGLYGILEFITSIAQSLWSFLTSGSGLFFTIIGIGATVLIIRKIRKE